MFLDEAAKTRFEDNFKDRVICRPREVNFEFFNKEPGLTVFQMFSLMGWRPFFAIKEKVYHALVKEFYANLSFSDLDGEIVGKSMLRGKKIDLTMRNLRAWIGLKEGDFKRYSTKEPISMEAYSHDKAVKKITGGISGEFILGQLSVNESLMAHVKLGKPKSEPDEGTSKRKMNVKHGRQPPKTAGRRKSSRLLKKESPTPSSPIPVSEEDKVSEEVDSDATMYSDSPTPPKTKDTMHSSSSEKKPLQDEQASVTSHPSVANPSSDHDQDPSKQPIKPSSPTSPRFSASSPEPTSAPLTPLAEIRAHLRSLTA
ncbi:uncharacterized protein G2W53_026804 [Senna tora]|uniref:Uncharacterized protein n=1 Tax=Senna tora TaxID=362788 RepID=A0A834THV3_9FABA|nr:uncharacterized protein G2W53_026804 [Senna tora]